MTGTCESGNWVYGIHGRLKSYILYGYISNFSYARDSVNSLTVACGIKSIIPRVGHERYQSNPLQSGLK